MKNKFSVVAILLAMVTALSFSNMVLVEEVRAEAASTKKRELISPADIERELQAARGEERLSRVEKIAKGYGVNVRDLHGLKLRSGKKDAGGDTIGKILSVVDSKKLLRLKEVLGVHGLKAKDCRKLPVGYVFYIPTKWIKESLRLDAYGVAKLQQRNQHLRAENSRLEGELYDERKAHNATRKQLKEEKAAHRQTRQDLKTAKDDINKQGTEISKKLGEIKEQDKRISILDATVLMWKQLSYGTWVGVVIALVIVVAVSFFRKRSNRRDDTFSEEEESSLKLQTEPEQKPEAPKTGLGSENEAGSEGEGLQRAVGQ